MIFCSEKNELIVDWSGIVNHACKTVLEPWDRGFKWSGESDGVTEDYDRLENPGIPLAMLADEPAASPWLKRIPAHLLPRLLDFEERFPDLIFPAMWFLSRYPKSIDLWLRYPALLAALLHSAKDEVLSERAVVELFSANGSEILAACGLRATGMNLTVSEPLPAYRTTRAHGAGLPRNRRDQPGQSRPGYPRRHPDFSWLGLLDPYSPPATSPC